jgi:hypothetical protein
MVDLEHFHLSQNKIMKKSARNNHRFREKQEKSIHSRILIVCDGENTEPSYFKKLISYSRNHNIHVVKVLEEPFGIWTNTCSTINLGKEKYLEYKRDKEKVDEIWCVFDADPKKHDPNQFRNFCSAFAQVTTDPDKPIWLHGVYSYEAFEYWLLLHLRDHDGSHIERDDHEDLINKRLPKEIQYKKDKKWEIWGGEISDGLWIELAKNNGVQKAIERARKIDTRGAGWHPQNCKLEDLWSSTNVYKLVERILWL